METEPFDAAWRADAVDRIDRLGRVVRQQLDGWDTAGPELDALLDEYMARVPRPVVCRDPFTHEPVRVQVDTLGLDGPWWRLDGPSRPRDEPLPPTYYAFTGAVRLREPYEDFGHTAWPGAIAPYVIPRLLLRPGVVAVVSELPVGRHRGWITVYFAAPPQPSGRRACEWGRDGYRVRTTDPAGPFDDWEEAYVYPVEWDHDLASWIEAGRLRWAEPGDPGGPLRDDVTGCPYVGLKGPDDPDGLGVLGYGDLEYLPYDDAAAGQTNPNEL